MRFPAIFVTGTGTDVGKTVVSAALIEAASQRQLSPLYWKPIQTGNQAEDQNAVRRLLRTAPKHCISQIPSWNFPLAASPDQAAAAASLPAPRLNELLQAFALHSDQFLVIEGAGGLLVPLNESNETWRDFIKSANLPIILVATSGLGTLNHTLLTLEALEQRGITVLAVILNGPCHEGNYTSLKRMRPEHRFYQFPQLNLDSSDPEFTKVSNDLLDFVLAAPMLHPHKDWMEADRLHCWHPYTQHKTANNPIAITGAKGIYLHTASGENLIDASASWWTNSTGHGHPKIGAAIARQQQKLDHSIFANATHEAASLLAQRLVKLSEHHLDRVFYSDNGSCAVEIALKMAAQSWQNQGQKQKNSFLFIQG
ncbi:MAG: dethiobiotin synthase, partial [Proteobacteria bacterium]|nr:dethiobiotin synthase [Pseudomonadota bacterium]